MKHENAYQNQNKWHAIHIKSTTKNNPATQQKGTNNNKLKKTQQRNEKSNTKGSSAASFPVEPSPKYGERPISNQHIQYK